MWGEGMKFEITLERMEEIALCIVHNDMTDDEAADYAKAVLLEVNDLPPSDD